MPGEYPAEAQGDCQPSRSQALAARPFGRREVLGYLWRIYKRFTTILRRRFFVIQRIRGMRMTVDDVLEYLASGMSEAEALADFPYLTREDIKACRSFAADRKPELKDALFTKDVNVVLFAECTDLSIPELVGVQLHLSADTELRWQVSVFRSVRAFGTNDNLPVVFEPRKYVMGTLGLKAELTDYLVKVAGLDRHTI